MSRAKRTGYAKGKAGVTGPGKRRTYQRKAVARGSNRVPGTHGAQVHDAEFLRKVVKFDSALLNFLRTLGYLFAGEDSNCHLTLPSRGPAPPLRAIL